MRVHSARIALLLHIVDALDVLWILDAGLDLGLAEAEFLAERDEGGDGFTVLRGALDVRLAGEGFVDQGEPVGLAGAAGEREDAGVDRRVVRGEFAEDEPDLAAVDV